MSRKHKFDLTHLVHQGHLKDGETVYFVSDPAQCATLVKQANGDYKITYQKEVTTIHALAQKLLGQEPPDHASRWFRNAKGQTLYEIWQNDEELAAAA